MLCRSMTCGVKMFCTLAEDGKRVSLSCLQSYLQDLQRVAEDFHYGGKVSALAKYSKDIQLVNVSKQVNSGVNLITFFGHSSATNLDFDIGYVSNPVMGYNNKGKYPTLSDEWL